MIDTCLQGLRYYQTYDWLFLRSIVSFGYIGWIVYSTLFILRAYIKIDSKFNLDTSPKVLDPHLADFDFYSLWCTL